MNETTVLGATREEFQDVLNKPNGGSCLDCYDEL